MPTYEYQCATCGERFDVVQRFTDKPLKKHAECGGDLQKVFHASGVVFKGSGYYVTDSRSSKSAAPSTAASSESNAASDSDSSKKGDSSNASDSSKKKPGSSESKSPKKPKKADSSAAAD